MNNDRAEIIERIRAYSRLQFQTPSFVPGETFLPVSGRVFDEDDLAQAGEALLDFWLTAGRFTEEFERALATYVGTKFCFMTNSGSSANLLAISALCSPELGPEKLNRGDEVLTLACGFPTTVNPILQNGLVPVFLDSKIPEFQADVSQLKEALSVKTKAIIFAHTLGNPFDLKSVQAFAREHSLWLIEDNCDALGSLYDGQRTGSFGDLSTLSFYPAHQITTGEGGAVLTSQPKLRRIVESLRDWGRSCWCSTGQSNSCGRRFDWQVGQLPHGYDHKYIYSHLGYNLKATEFQAAIGLAQLKKLPKFIQARRRNFDLLRNSLRNLESVFTFAEPTQNSIPAWFGFPLLIRENALFSRNELIQFLASKKIDTRAIFGGNLSRQPAYQNESWRSIGDLSNSDALMSRGLWLGVFPGLQEEHIDYISQSIHDFIDSLSSDARKEVGRCHNSNSTWTALP